MKTIGFILKRDTAQAEQTATLVADALLKANVRVLIGADAPQVPGATVVSPEELAEMTDCMIVIGGDGTFLAAARLIYGKKATVIGINLGRVGFLTEIETHNVTTFVAQLLAGDYKCEERPYFTATFVQNGQTVTEPFINDAVMQRDAREKMIDYDVDVGGNYMMSGKSDGLIVATPTGSTAYNLSTGGPIVYPTLEGLILSPISPHKLSFRPVVVPPAKVVVTLNSPQANLSLDGRTMGLLHKGDTLVIERATHNLKLLHDPSRNFFDLLRIKLGWN